MIDTHTHLDLPEYAKNLEVYAMRASATGVHGVAVVGYLARYFSRIETTCAHLNATGLINAYPVLGLHPAYIDTHEDGDLLVLEEALARQSPIAVGEIGLDTYTPELKATLPRQIKYFEAQLEIAHKAHLPLNLHIRKAHAKTLEILKRHTHHGGVAHAFGGGKMEACAFIKAGFCLGITPFAGNIHAKKLRTAISAAYATYGLNAFVLETDCPDMLPPKLHGTIKRSEPAFLGYAAKALAQITGERLDRVIAATSANARRIYRLEDL